MGAGVVRSGRPPRGRPDRPSGGAPRKGRPADPSRSRPLALLVYRSGPWLGMALRLLYDWSRPTQHAGAGGSRRDDPDHGHGNRHRRPRGDPPGRAGDPGGGPGAGAPPRASATAKGLRSRSAGFDLPRVAPVAVEGSSGGRPGLPSVPFRPSAGGAPSVGRRPWVRLVSAPLVLAPRGPRGRGDRVTHPPRGRSSSGSSIVALRRRRPTRPPRAPGGGASPRGPRLGESERHDPRVAARISP
jgi:hypothetical protein